MTTFDAFGPKAFCFKHCYTYCSQSGRYLHPPHKHKLRDLIFDKDKQNYQLARQICEYLLSSPQHKSQCERVVEPLYCRLLSDSGKTMEDWKLCEKHCLKAIEINDRDFSVHNTYAVVLEDKLKNFDKAGIHYQKSLKWCPSNKLINFNFANFLVRRQKKYQESLKYWEKWCPDVESVTEQVRWKLRHYFHALFKCGMFEKCSAIIDKYTSLGGNLNRRATKYTLIKKYCEYLLKNKDIIDINDKKLQKLVFILVDNDDKPTDFFQAWYNGDLQDLSVIQLISFMKVCQIPVKLLLDFINSKMKCEDEIVNLTKKRNEVIELMETYLIPILSQLADLTALELTRSDQDEKENLNLDKLENNNDNYKVWMKKDSQLRNTEKIKDGDEFLDEYHNVINITRQQRDVLFTDWTKDMKEMGIKRQEVQVSGMNCLHNIICSYIYTIFYKTVELCFVCQLY